MSHKPTSNLENRIPYREYLETKVITDCHERHDMSGSERGKLETNENSGKLILRRKDRRGFNEMPLL